jgi:hypothetical protein
MGDRGSKDGVPFGTGCTYPVTVEAAKLSR